MLTGYAAEQNGYSDFCHVSKLLYQLVTCRRAVLRTIRCLVHHIRRQTAFRTDMLSKTGKMPGFLTKIRQNTQGRRCLIFYFIIIHKNLQGVSEKKLAHFCIFLRKSNLFRKRLDNPHRIWYTGITSLYGVYFFAHLRVRTRFGAAIKPIRILREAKDSESCSGRTAEPTSAYRKK